MSCGCTEETTLPPCNTGCTQLIDSNCIVYAKAITCFEYPYQSYNVPINSRLQLVIDSLAGALCALSTNTIAWSSFNYACLTILGDGGPITTAEEFVTSISDYVCNLHTQITSNSSSITSINSSITSINSSITSINSSISTINTNVTEVEADLAEINAAILDETWKNVGAGGTMANGQAVPSFVTGWSNVGGNTVTRLRKRANGEIELYIDAKISYDGNPAHNPTPSTIFVLPVGYRPAAKIISTGITSGSQDDSNLYKHFISIFANGSITISIIDTLTPSAGTLEVPVTIVFDTV